MSIGPCGVLLYLMPAPTSLATYTRQKGPTPDSAQGTPRMAASSSAAALRSRDGTIAWSSWIVIAGSRIAHSGVLLRWNLGLHELRKQRERVLPAEIAGLGRNGFGYAFLQDVQLGSAGYLLQGYRRPHLAGQVRVVERVRVPNALVSHQLEILSAKRVALPRREVRKRHLVGAANLGVHMVNLAGKAVRREPFGHGVGFKKRPIDSFRRRPQHTVKSDSVCGHRHGSPRFPRLIMHISPSPLRLYRHSFLPSISRCRGQHGTDTTGHRSVTAQVLLLHRCRC